MYNNIYTMRINGQAIPLSAGNVSSALVVQQNCANTAGNQLMIRSNSDTNKQLLLGFVDSDPPQADPGYTNTGVAPYSSLQSIQQLTGVKPLYLQPYLGDVIVGCRSGKAGWIKPKPYNVMVM